MKILKTISEIITGTRPGPKLQVEILTACLVTEDGRTWTAAAGDVIVLPEESAKQLVAAERARILPSDAAQAEASRLRAMIPPPWEPRPMPEVWSELPEGIHRLWALEEKIRCLAGRHAEIEAVYFRGRGLDAYETTLAGKICESAGGGNFSKSALVERFLTERKSVAYVSGGLEAEKDLRYLGNAWDRAAEALEHAIDETREERIQRRIELGDRVIAMAEANKKLCRELASIGFDIFKRRVEALGLGANAVKTLFQGTSEQLSFIRQPLSLSDCKLGWIDETTGIARTTHEPETLGQLANNLLRFAANNAALEELLAEAQRQLAATADQPTSRRKAA